MFIVATDITKILTFVNVCKLKEYPAFLLKRHTMDGRIKNYLSLFHFLCITAVLKKKDSYKEQINK